MNFDGNCYDIWQKQGQLDFEFSCRLLTFMLPLIDCHFLGHPCHNGNDSLPLSLLKLEFNDRFVHWN